MSTLTHNDRLMSIGMSTRMLTDTLMRHFENVDADAFVNGMTWYDDAQNLAQDLATVTPYNVNQIATAIAAHSIRTQWVRNKAAVIAMVLHDEELPGIMARNNAWAREALNSDDPFSVLKGNKTNRFARNIAGDTNSVTVDVWAARAVNVPEKALSRVGVYEAVERVYQLAAKRAGIAPREFQAIIWCHVRGRAD